MTHLAGLSWPEAAGRGGFVLAVPVGSTEQHGPHLPLSTDTDIAVALAEALAPPAETTSLVAPPVPYGASGEHAGFPGTLSIGPAATELLLVELGRSASATARRLLLSRRTVATPSRSPAPCAGCVREGRDVLAWSPRWRRRRARRPDGDLGAARADPARVRTGRRRGGQHRRPGASSCPRCARGGVPGGQPERRARRPGRRVRRGGPAAAGGGDRGPVATIADWVPGSAPPPGPRPSTADGRSTAGRDRVALVTGAARGIGAATVRALAAERLVQSSRSTGPRTTRGCRYRLGTRAELTRWPAGAPDDPCRRRRHHRRGGARARRSRRPSRRSAAWTPPSPSPA